MQSLTYLITLLCCLIPLAARADNWPAWRGPHGNGQCSEQNLPLRWSPNENVRWKLTLPGPGNSTPIVWGDKIFLTQATEQGHKRSLFCIDRTKGEPLWQRTTTYAENESTHETNPYCSASPVTDGRHVVVSHGSAGVVCYDFQGSELWRRDLGKCEHIWGNAASPILWKNLVILNFGPGERTFLIALEKETGSEVWRVNLPGGKRGDKGQDEWLGSWSTPVIHDSNGRAELIMSWPGAVTAYDPQTGTANWTCTGLEKQKEPDRLIYTSPLVASDVVVAMAGYGGPSLAVRMGGQGNVTASHRLWRAEKGPQRIGSGVIVGDHVYMVNEPGTAQCIELKTGKILWTERVGATVWGSLVHAAGKLFVTNTEGETLVLAAKPKFEVLNRNQLKERTLASIAVSGECLFIRTYNHLWCIGK